MTNDSKRLFGIVAGIGLLAIGYFGMNYLGSLKEEPPTKPDIIRRKAVTTMAIQNESVATTLDIQGALLRIDMCA